MASQAAFRVVLDAGGAPAVCAQRFLDLFYQRFTKPWRPKGASAASGMSAFIPAGAPRVVATVRRVDGDGDCLFATLDGTSAKDSCRKDVAKWMERHAATQIDLPSNAHGGHFCDTVEHMARNAYPGMDFESYCAVMALPVLEGGIWGECLEFASLSILRQRPASVYVRDGEEFAGSGSFVAPHGAEKHVLWNGSHLYELLICVSSPGFPARAHVQVLLFLASPRGSP